MTAACANPQSSWGGPSPGFAWDEMLAHRGYLVRFAQRRLRDPMLAEDVVHDVFEAVLSGRAAFAGRSALRSWLTAILKHKIVDLVRQRVGLESLDAGEEDEPLERVSLAAQPDELAEQRELLAQTLRRIETLPRGLREAITLRVLHDQPTETVCQALAITENNLFQRLFRARRLLAAPMPAMMQ
jgi:RNA polymerase sigma-70 factor (ECF subfamily)